MNNMFSFCKDLILKQKKVLISAKNADLVRD